jgi:hypothetical protein
MNHPTLTTLHKPLSLLILSTLLFSTTFVPLTSARTTHSWSTTTEFNNGTFSNITTSSPDNLSLTLQGTPTTDSTESEFTQGTALTDTFPSHKVSQDGTLSLGHSWRYTTSTTIHSHLSGNLLYVSMIGGLSVVDTKGTPSPADDELVITYSTTSTPAIGHNTVWHSHLSDNLLYVGTHGGGLSVIDTKGTQTPADDTLVFRYTTSTTPAIGHNRAYHSHLSGNLIYVSTNGGLSVIDTKGTFDDASDDELVFRYTTSTTPAIGHNSVGHSHLSGNLLYVSSWIDGGLSVIDTKGTFDDASDDELVFKYSTTSTPAIAFDSVLHSQLTDNLLYVGTYGGGLSVIDIKGTQSPVDDELVITYSSTSTPAIANAMVRHSHISQNLLYLSVEPNVTGAMAGLSVIDTTSEHHALTTSYVSKAHPITSPLTTLLTDRVTPSGTSVTLYYRTGEEGSWSTWSTPCILTTCPINEDDLTDADFIQYRLDLSTTDSLITPSVNSVTLTDGYETTGTYTSNTLSFPTTTDLFTFSADTTVPTGTTLAFEYSTNGTKWLPITAGSSFPRPTKTKDFTWRATFTTTNPSLTPTIQSIEITSSPSTTPSSSSFASPQITTPTEQATPEDPTTPEETSPSLTTDSSRVIAIRKEIISLLRQIITLLERVREMRGRCDPTSKPRFNLGAVALLSHCGEVEPWYKRFKGEVLWSAISSIFKNGCILWELVLLKKLL